MEGADVWHGMMASIFTDDLPTQDEMNTVTNVDEVDRSEYERNLIHALS